ncbi:MAG: elongation factor P [SAR202 cluster bacterium]|jgi:elongation factor P|nr:elongation factor P [SAR202 cluster bacterium]HAE32780.1 elongation factor P [Dehalococcoidia bacterium]|tara:strand:- start:1313 stop:1876 length:564 start_codon:yes stop_codon:yes gene_type:complete
MTIGYGDLRKGMSIELDGEPFSVVEYERSKMQQRAPVMRIRFRSLRTGRVVDKTFSGYDVNFTQADVERRKAQYIYEDSGLYYFMDTNSYEQFPMSADQMGDALRYVIEQTEVDLVFFGDNPISLDLPITVDLKVVSSPPGVKGDTAQGASKFATLETGLEITVPLFVNEGDSIKVDTRSGEYLSRS